MHMLKERLQVLIGTEQRRRLEREAMARGTSVATLVREAIDFTFPPEHAHRAEAAAVLLTAEPMPVGDPDTLASEIDELRSRFT